MPYSFKQRVILGLAPITVASVLRSLAFSWRLREAGARQLSARLPQPEPRIYAFWHEGILGTIGAYRDSAIHPFASQSFDGELITRTLDHLGFLETARGSSSRGGAGGLMELKRFVEQGDHVVFTVDGPRGPRRKVQEGVIKLAQLSGRAIVPVGVFFRPAARLRSWDTMQIPAPFSLGIFRFGAEIRVPRELSDLSDYVRQLQDSLERETLFSEKGDLS